METPNKSLKENFDIIGSCDRKQKCFTAYIKCTVGSPRWKSVQALSHIHDDPDGSSRQPQGEPRDEHVAASGCADDAFLTKKAVSK